MLNCGRALGLKLRELASDWSGLAQLTLPAVGVLRTGGFLFLGQIVEDRVVVADVTSRRPKYMSREELEDIWDGRVITVSPKRAWKDFLPRIDRLPRLDAVIGNLKSAAERVTPFAVCYGNGCDVRSRRTQPFIRSIRHNEAASADPAQAESALLALVIMLHCHGIGAEPEQIRHRIGSARIGVPEMLRCAKEMDLKAQFLSTAGSGWRRPRCRASRCCATAAS